jgi:hypothetical protein
VKNRPVTKWASVSEAVAAGLAAVPCRSLNAAVWLTNTPPVRFAERCTPASSAAVRAAASTCGDVEYTEAVSAPWWRTVSTKTSRLCAVESVAMRNDTGPNHSRV